MSASPKIKDKIAKLIALASDKSATTGEIENAVAAASRLMLQHNLARADIDFKSESHGVSSIGLGRQCAYSKTYTIKLWESMLIDFVCEFIGYAYSYTTTPQPLERAGAPVLDSKGNQRNGCEIWFYGCADSCEMAIKLFEQLRSTIADSAIKRYRAWSRGNGANYCEGFCIGLREANRRAKKALRANDKQCAELILKDSANQKKVMWHSKAWLQSEHGITLTRGRRSGGGSGTRQAREQGILDGSKHQFQRPNQKQELP